MSGARARISSALPAGLRWRLTAWVAGVMAVSAAVVFFVVYQDTGAQLRSEIDRDISGDTSQMIQSLNAISGQRPSRISGGGRAVCHHPAVQRDFDAAVRAGARCSA